MSKEEIKKLSPEEKIKIFNAMGIFALVGFVVAFIFLCRLKFGDALIFASLSMPYFFGWLLKKYLNEIFIVILLLFPLFFMLSSHPMQVVMDVVFKDKPQQHFCGKFAKKYDVGGKKPITYWLIKNMETNEKMSILELPRYNIFTVGDDVCFDYAIDEHWQDSPYVFKIYKDVYKEK